MTGVGLQGAHVHGICFHGIGTPERTLEPGEDRYWVAIDEFLAMLDAIAAAPGVRISFDDGNASDIEIALGGLRERDLSASFFVLAGRRLLCDCAPTDGHPQRGPRQSRGDGYCRGCA